MFTLPKLNFTQEDIKKYISKKTLYYHYNKHHQIYIDNTNKLIKGTKFQDMDLVDIIKSTYNNPKLINIYNNASQVFNHNVYWNSFNVFNNMDKETRTKLFKKYKSKNELKRILLEKANNMFGSGYLWLVEKNGVFDIIPTNNSFTPVIYNNNCIMNIDLWEHSYYLDYQNDRNQYLTNFMTILGL